MPPESIPRLGYVLKRYPRFSETFVVNEILAHEAAGAQIDIFALGPVEETHFQDAIARVRAPVTRLQHRLRNGDALWQLIVRACRELPRFAERMAPAEEVAGDLVGQAIQLALEAKARGIEHLHAHFGTQAATVTRLAAAFADIAYTFTAHAKDIYYEYEEPVRLDQKMRDAACTVTVSDYNLAYLRERYGTAAERTLRLYNGLDLAHFRWQPPPPRADEILAVGRLVEKKGFDVLLEALAVLKARGVECRCTLIGDGPLRAQLEAQRAALGLEDRLSMPGLRPQPEVQQALREAALLAAPCVVSADGDRDGLPTVLLEAMALGTPCISTRVAGIPELVRDGDTGLCVEGGDARALADAIEQLLGDPVLRERLSANARRLIEADYDIHRNAAIQRELFRRARDGRHGRAC
ncbi:glycosyltransferase [Thauera sp. Sel9]|uniref:glycosyltransferase n=1 Tax=Thauera sp. Sel9 TaxID=2974299 RepID=UPI0021E1A6BC|nr:glycosyltransferase [Thauera sp. Sel9]MCV2216420.1 glycosyltransferase [Thauera sp. Sel9]